MVTTRVRWEVAGDYFENCNCEFLCPCVLSGMQATPTEGHCDVPLAFHITEGHFEDVELSGLNVVLILFTPGPMIQGNWTVAAYIDERATPAQREALGGIFTGAAGGPLAALGGLIGTNLGAKFVPITYSIEGNTRRVTIPNILEMNVEGVRGANRSEPAYLDNVGHPVSTRLATAKGTRMSYQDHDWTWDNTGRNGHFAPFRWQAS